MKRIILWLLLIFLIFLLCFLVFLRHSNEEKKLNNKSNNIIVNDSVDEDNRLISFQKNRFNKTNYSLVSKIDTSDYYLEIFDDYISVCDIIKNKCDDYKYSLNDDVYSLFDSDGNSLEGKYKLDYFVGYYCFLDYTVDDNNYDIYYFNENI